MRFVRTVAGGALGLSLGAPPLVGQSMIPDYRAQQLSTTTLTLPRPTAFESQFAIVRPAGLAPGHRLDGATVRLVYATPGPDGEGTPLARRVELALFATWAPAQRVDHDTRWSAIGAGVAADVRALATPLAGRVDPFVSVGAGLLRMTRANEMSPLVRVGDRWVRRPLLADPAPAGARARTDFALSPGAGVRLRLSRRLALQADARDLLTLRGGARHNVVAGTGLRLTL